MSMESARKFAKEFYENDKIMVCISVGKVVKVTDKENKKQSLF